MSLLCRTVQIVQVKVKRQHCFPSDQVVNRDIAHKRSRDKRSNVVLPTVAIAQLNLLCESPTATHSAPLLPAKRREIHLFFTITASLSATAPSSEMVQRESTISLMRQETTDYTRENPRVAPPPPVDLPPVPRPPFMSCAPQHLWPGTGTGTTGFASSTSTATS